MKQLNSGPFPAIHAFCKDPSEIHRGYVRTLIDAGVNLDGINCQGYKSLDYAVYNGDSETEAMVVQGLQLQLAGGVESKVKRRRFEATVRKAYRDLFETKLRPLIRSKHRDTLKRMQDLYAVELAKNVFYQETFDQLRYVPYPDFLASQRLPRYADGTLRSHKAPLHPDAKNNAQHVVFVSYRWIRKDPVTGKTAPDDFIHTQYKLMLTALEQYLAVHPELDPAKFGIWMVSKT